MAPKKATGSQSSKGRSCPKLNLSRMNPRCAAALPCNRMKIIPISDHATIGEHFRSVNLR